MTEPLTQALLLAGLAGLAIPVGALLAMADRVLPRWHEAETRHAIVAFGAGALLAAVALVLIPEGSAKLPTWLALTGFAAGGLAFFAADRALERHGGRAANFMAMMLDFLPEAMALGAVLSDKAATAMLLALMIALQNIPEGFSAFRELSPGGRRRWHLLGLFVLMVPLGPLAAAGGLLFLMGMPQVLGMVMMFSSGGILYLMFQDVAPQVPLERHWGPPLGAVAGFLLGLAGHLALH